MIAEIYTLGQINTAIDRIKKNKVSGRVLISMKN